MNTADAVYQGWDMDGTREADDAANYARVSPSPGFTAINQDSLLPDSPPQTSALSQIQSREVKALSAARSGRRRNPTVASYLGLGDSDEPAHLVKYAPTPDGQPPPSRPARKRRSPRNGEKAASKKTPALSRTAAPNQSRASGTVRDTKLSTQDEGVILTPAATAPCMDLQQISPQVHTLHSATVECSTASELDKYSTHGPFDPLNDDDDNFGQLCFDFEIDSRNADSSIPSTHISEQPGTTRAQSDDEDFDDDLMDDDLLDLTADTTRGRSSPGFHLNSPEDCIASNKAARPGQVPETAAVNDNTPKGEACSSSGPLKRFVSPVTLTTRILAATGDETRKPIVRPPFPNGVRDRSPIIGMSTNTVLRSCFRVGEAISQSCHAAKAGNNILIELYARVLNSERDDLHQRFTFCDLFHAKPPYIQATYAVAIWKTVQLFEYDSARLLQQGRMCRCIGTMKRNGKEWTMTVLNIWEATWDDVQWVEGIMNS